MDDPGSSTSWRYLRSASRPSPSTSRPLFKFMVARDQVKKAVQRLEQNAGPSPPKRVGKILRHVQHFLLQLSANVASLSVALECAEIAALPDSWVKSLLDSRGASSSSETDGADPDLRLASVVQHVFSTLLRLHDGLILVTSGECRHEADAKLARSSPYPSRLTSGDGGESNVYRRDGVYSGTGWDEWADPLNGLQARLVQSAGKPWEALAKNAGIEPLLNLLEAEIRQLEDSFSRLKTAVERALLSPLQRTLRAANVKIKLSFQCKMERMTVQAPAAKYSMEWKRLAGQFQLGETVLPQKISREEWERILFYREPATGQSSSSSSAALAPATVPDAPPKSKVQKRKLQCMLDDSDDEDESVEAPWRGDLPTAEAHSSSGAAPSNTTATVTTTGLVVQQKQSRDAKVRDRVGPAPNQPCDSVNDIKAAMGVDGTDLEASHAALQEEETAALDEAQRVDSLEESENYERKYKALRKELDRALRKGPQPVADDDDDLIWDLRDCARLAAMEAGNQNLLSDGLEEGQRDAVDRRKALERALFFFNSAQELVDDQQRLHDRMTRRRGGDENGQNDATSGLFQRNLLFLKGQAHVNAAIALVELFRVKPKASWKQQANEQFHLAGQCVESLRTETAKDNHSSIDAKLDEIKATELRLLSCRWQCVLNWISGERSRAIQRFRDLMSDEVSTVDEPIAANECAEAVIKVRIELYHCGVTMADLIVSALEAARVSRIRHDVSEFDVLLGVFEEAVNVAAHQSVLLFNSVEQLESTWLCDANILDENGIQTQDELRQFLQSTQDWWSRKVALSLQPIQHDERHVGDRMEQSTEFSAFAQDDAVQPPRRLVVYGSSTFPKKARPRRAVLGSGSGNVGLPTRCRPPRPEPRKYRRWGDELLPQVMDENGRLVPKLTYPSIAPEMPPEIKALFDSLRLASA